MGIMEIVLPVAVCYIVTAIAGKLLIPALVKLKAGQSIKEIGPSWHMTKQGTPTMGGLMFIIGIGLTFVGCGWQRMMAGSCVHLYVYLFALVFGVIGYIDDYQKVKHHQNTGLTAPQKFILQLAAASRDVPLVIMDTSKWRITAPLQSRTVVNSMHGALSPAAALFWRNPALRCTNSIRLQTSAAAPHLPTCTMGCSHFRSTSYKTSKFP